MDAINTFPDDADLEIMPHIPFSTSCCSHDFIPRPVDTGFFYSAEPNSLGLLSEEGDAYLPPGISFDAAEAVQFDLRRRVPQISSYNFATGWVQKPSGEWEYVASGTIEEVAEQEELSDLVMGMDQDADCEGMPTQPLPPSATPPPAPELGMHHLDLLPDSPSPSTQSNLWPKFPQISSYDFAPGWVQHPSGEWEYIGAIGQANEREDLSDLVMGMCEDATCECIPTQAPLPSSATPPPAPELGKHHLDLLPDSPSLETPVQYSMDDPATMRLRATFVGSRASSITSGPEEQESTYIAGIELFPIYSLQAPQVLSPSVVTSPLSSCGPERFDFQDSSSFDGYAEDLLPAEEFAYPAPSPATFDLFAFHDSPDLPPGSMDGDMMPLEQRMVANNLYLLKHAAVELEELQRDLHSHTFEFDFQVYLEVCQRTAMAIMVAMNSLIVSSNEVVRRRKGNSNWHKQFMDRSQSLQRTVTRLRALLERLRPPRFHKLPSSIGKLEEHEQKLLNLAAKFESSSKRLKVRSIQAQIAKAHAESHYARTSPTASRFGLGSERRLPRRSSRPFLRRTSVSGIS